MRVLQLLLVRTMYAVARVSAGLLLHPYLTMQSLVKDSSLIWLTVTPTVMLALTTILWRAIIVPVVGLLFPCASLPNFACDILPFIGNIVAFFCVYWQVILFYLLYRFSNVFRKSH